MIFKKNYNTEETQQGLLIQSSGIKYRKKINITATELQILWVKVKERNIRVHYSSALLGRGPVILGKTLAVLGVKKDSGNHQLQHCRSDALVKYRPFSISVSLAKLPDGTIRF